MILIGIDGHYTVKKKLFLPSKKKNSKYHKTWYHKSRFRRIFTNEYKNRTVGIDGPSIDCNLKKISTTITIMEHFRIFLRRSTRPLRGEVHTNVLRPVIWTVVWHSAISWRSTRLAARGNLWRSCGCPRPCWPRASMMCWSPCWSRSVRWSLWFRWPPLWIACLKRDGWVN